MKSRLFEWLILIGFILTAVGLRIECLRPVIVKLYQGSLCPFYHLTGIQCPGCGMTRAFLSLAQFKIKTALRYNPFSLVLLGIIVLRILPWNKRAEQLLNQFHFYEILLVVVLIWWFSCRLMPALCHKFAF